MKMKKILALAAASLTAAALAVSACAEPAGLDIKLNNWAHRNSLNMSKAYYQVDEEEMDAVPGFKANDVEITGDGQYTVGVEFDTFTAKDGEDAFWRVLKLETGIVAEGHEDVKITIDKLTVDGKEVEGAKSAVQMNSKPEASDDYDDQTLLDYKTEYIVVELFNEWNPDSKYIASSDYGRKVEVTFTVTGLKAAEGEAPSGDATEAPAGTTGAQGDVNKPSTDKGQPNTGVEGVAVVAGLAVLATGAVVIAKKRK
ncbi:MAG TPA: hypothetical protein DDX91_01635 [Ruminococcaceae bacterium]|nr:hypothetical protein [Oscillospiraceae bacterium]